MDIEEDEVDYEYDTSRSRRPRSGGAAGRDGRPGKHAVVPRSESMDSFDIQQQQQQLTREASEDSSVVQGQVSLFCAGSGRKKGVWQDVDTIPRSSHSIAR